jgi:hypothetical protein
MKGILRLLLVLSIFSCKRGEQEDVVLSKKQTTPAVKSSNLLKLDTVFFSYDRKTKCTDYALIRLKSKRYLKNRACLAKFQLDFFQKGRLVYSKAIGIKGLDEGSEWYGNFELDTIASPLRTITVGYPACGYNQYNYLFYIKEKESQLLFQWDSMSDGEWGSWGEIFKGSADDFYYRHITFGGGDEEDSDESIGIAEYSDSIHFKKLNSKWSLKYLTPKDQVYRQKKQSYQEFNSRN